MRVSPVEFLRQDAINKDDHAIRYRGDFAGIARVEQNNPSRLGEAPHDAVHFPLGADIDAARRIVEHEHGRGGLDPLGKDNLLLIAARQRADRLLHRAGDNAELPAAFDRNAPQPFGVQHKSVPAEGERADADDVLGNALPQHQAVLLAVRRRVGNSGLDGAGGIARQPHTGRQRDGAGFWLGEAEQYRE